MKVISIDKYKITLYDTSNTIERNKNILNPSTIIAAMVISSIKDILKDEPLLCSFVCNLFYREIFFANDDINFDLGSCTFTMVTNPNSVVDKSIIESIFDYVVESSTNPITGYNISRSVNQLKKHRIYLNNMQYSKVYN